MELKRLSIDDLNKLSVRELQDLLSKEESRAKELRGLIKTKMLKISSDFKRYEVGRTKNGGNVNFNNGENIKRQLINKIMGMQKYNEKLRSQWNEIKGLDSKQLLHKALTSFDNIEVSKQVEILRNIGYSESEIDIILAQIRGDEEYEELRDKAEQIMVDWYLENGGEIADDDYAVNPYAI